MLTKTKISCGKISGLASSATPFETGISQKAFFEQGFDKAHKEKLGKFLEFLGENDGKVGMYS